MVWRICRCVAATILATAWALAAASPAAADIIDPPGACVGSAAWTAGAVTITSTDLNPDAVIEIPRADEVTWSGKVVGPEPGVHRPVEGTIKLVLPPPLPPVALGSWGGGTSEVERSGLYTYSLPAVVPAGVELELLAHHDENGKRHCTAHTKVMVVGDAFDSVLVWPVLVGLGLVGGGLVLLFRSLTRPSPQGVGPGRVLAGGVLGLLFGLLAALTLVLFGVLPLAHVLVITMPVVGAALGALLVFLGGRWQQGQVFGG